MSREANRRGSKPTKQPWIGVRLPAERHRFADDGLAQHRLAICGLRRNRFAVERLAVNGLAMTGLAINGLGRTGQDTEHLHERSTVR